MMVLLKLVTQYPPGTELEKKEIKFDPVLLKSQVAQYIVPTPVLEQIGPEKAKEFYLQTQEQAMRSEAKEAAKVLKGVDERSIEKTVKNIEQLSIQTEQLNKEIEQFNLEVSRGVPFEKIHEYEEKRSILLGRAYEIQEKWQKLQPELLKLQEISQAQETISQYQAVREAYLQERIKNINVGLEAFFSTLIPFYRSEIPSFWSRLAGIRQDPTVEKILESKKTEYWVGAGAGVAAEAAASYVIGMGLGHIAREVAKSEVIVKFATEHPKIATALKVGVPAAVFAVPSVQIATLVKQGEYRAAAASALHLATVTGAASLGFVHGFKGGPGKELVAETKPEIEAEFMGIKKEQNYIAQLHYKIRISKPTLKDAFPAESKGVSWPEIYQLKYRDIKELLLFGKYGKGRALEFSGIKTRDFSEMFADIYDITYLNRFVHGKQLFAVSTMGRARRTFSEWWAIEPERILEEFGFEYRDILFHSHKSLFGLSPKESLMIGKIGELGYNLPAPPTKIQPIFSAGSKSISTIPAEKISVPTETLVVQKAIPVEKISVPTPNIPKVLSGEQILIPKTVKVDVSTVPITLPQLVKPEKDKKVITVPKTLNKLSTIPNAIKNVSEINAIKNVSEISARIFEETKTAQRTESALQTSQPLETSQKQIQKTSQEIERNISNILRSSAFVLPPFALGGGGGGIISRIPGRRPKLKTRRKIHVDPLERIVRKIEKTAMSWGGRRWKRRARR